MRVLTVRQPWAYAILHLGKNVENRSWATRHRGVLGIHAAARVDREAVEMLRCEGLWLPPELPTGAIVGTVMLVDVRDALTEPVVSPWATDSAYHWLVADPHPCEPVPMRGRLGLWRFPPPVASSVG